LRPVGAYADLHGAGFLLLKVTAHVTVAWLLGCVARGELLPSMSQIVRMTIMCRKLIHLICSVLVLGMALASVADAGDPILKLDINNTNTPAETEEGFVSFTRADSGSQVDGVTVELGGTLDSRRRDAPAGIPFEQIYRDFIFSRPGGMTVTLSGLTANTTYEITIYAWDTSSIETRVADWTANGIALCQAAFDGAQNPPAAEDDYAFSGTATADAGGTILLESAGGEGTREASGASHPFAFLNGLVISSTAPITEARRPFPADGTLYKDTWVNLTWIPGDIAVSNDFYMGDNFDDVNNGTADTFRGTQAAASLLVGFFGYPYPDGLAPGTTYYWRVDGINEAEPNSPWKGNVWSFRVQPRTAYNNSPSDGMKNVLQGVTLSWTAGMGASLHQVYFGDNLDEVANAVGAAMQTDATYTPATLESGKTYYWRVDEFDGIVTYKGNVWSFNTAPLIEVTDPNMVGLWTFDEGMGATAVDWSGHGNHGIIEGEPKWADGYELGALELDGEDDVVEVPLQPSITFEQGDSFSVLAWINTEATPSPQDGIVGNYRTSTTPFWLLIANEDGGATMFIRDVDRAHSTLIASPGKINDGNWHHLAGVRDQQARYLSLYVDGQLVVEEFDETEDINSGQSIWIGDHLNRYYDGLIDEVRLYNKALTAEEIAHVIQIDPKLADDPVPNRHATVDIRKTTSLSWSAGDTAASHDVYFSTDRDAIAGADNNSPTFQGNQAGTSLSLAGMIEFGGIDYYWRVDEVEADGTAPAGTIWKFTVPNYLIIDDFEIYDVNNNEIWWSWKDGLGYPARDGIPGFPGNNTGSMVGDETSPTYMEMSIVHGGAKSMPMWYTNNNPTGAKYSEVEFTVPVGERDWTIEGIGELSLWFRGEPTNALEPMYVAVGNTAVVYHDDPNATQVDSWTEWVIPLPDLADRGVDLANVDSIALGVGTRGNDTIPGTMGKMYFDEILLKREDEPQQ